MSDLEHRARIDKLENRVNVLQAAHGSLSRMVCDGDTMVPPLSEASRNKDHITALTGLVNRLEDSVAELLARADREADCFTSHIHDEKGIACWPDPAEHESAPSTKIGNSLREHKHVPSDIALDPPSSDKDGPQNLSDVLNIIAEAWNAHEQRIANLNTGDIDLTPIADRINQDSDVSNDNFDRIAARIDDLHARISILEETTKASIHIAELERRRTRTDDPAVNYPAGSQAICPICKSMYAPGMACPVCYPVTTATG